MENVVPKAIKYIEWCLLMKKLLLFNIKTSNFGYEFQILTFPLTNILLILWFSIQETPYEWSLKMKNGFWHILCQNIILTPHVNNSSFNISVIALRGMRGSLFGRLFIICTTYYADEYRVKEKNATSFVINFMNYNRDGIKLLSNT